MCPVQVENINILFQQIISLFAAKIAAYMADGGITSNSFIMNFLASLLNKPVVNIGIPDVSALGAAYLAGLNAGVYMNIDYLKELNADKIIILPSGEKKIKAYYKGWKNVITNT